MTLPLPCPPAANICADPTSAPQRKRRRRAPASGASDDCFACVKRNSKCDRRRPYCTPCLDIGKECSGYKTQLTWGVGVASRGKLRGLSLPVARSAPVVKSPSSTRTRALSTTSQASEKDVKVKSESTGSLHNPFTTYDFVNMAPNGVANNPPMQMPQWEMGVSHEYPMPDYHHPETMNHQQPQRQLPQLHRIHTYNVPRNSEGILSGSLDSLSAYAESDYASPISQSYQNDEIPFLNSPHPIYNSYPARNGTAESPVPGAMMGDSRGPTSCPDQYYAQSEISSSISSHQNLYDIPENRAHQSSPSTNEIFYDDDLLGRDAYATSARSSHFTWASVNDNDDVASQAASDAETSYRMGHESHDSLSSSTSEMSPRVSFFLDYYEKIICPSVVVMDSPQNPYREHILSLASSSPSLQHAICALAACNLRMKRKQSLAHDHWRQQPFELELQDHINGGRARPTCVRRTSFSYQRAPDPAPSDATLQEEYQHRTLAVSLLNQQLSDPSTARQDCVLATLFILCHYRMCESGIAQFRTQFAGVKKILGMRESGVETGNWGWMESCFTYFDGIAASTNDREAQLRGGYLEMIINPGNPNHALENLVGCDAVLFRTIAKLGRLNLLSQHRPVLADPSSIDSKSRTPPPPRSGLSGQALADFYNLHAHAFDGNGFASTIEEPLTINHSHDELRTTFWTEWKAARAALQDWEFDANRVVPSLPSVPSAALLRDLTSLSEAFRYSALLYTERLASPHLLSSHLNFQNLVSQVLYYVTSLEAGSDCEKFLLWPLFVAGSECVNELQRGIVRNKVGEMGGRSGYGNGRAGLEILEKLWREGEADGERGAVGGGPFKWMRWMEGGDGEWIMV